MTSRAPRWLILALGVALVVFVWALTGAGSDNVTTPVYGVEVSQ